MARGTIDRIYAAALTQRLGENLILLYYNIIKQGRVYSRRIRPWVFILVFQLVVPGLEIAKC